MTAAQSAYFNFVRWLHRFEEHPHFNRLGAGLYSLLWTEWCGYGWRFAWRMALIYWMPSKPNEDPPIVTPEEATGWVRLAIAVGTGLLCLAVFLPFYFGSRLT